MELLKSSFSSVYLFRSSITCLQHRPILLVFFEFLSFFFFPFCTNFGLCSSNVADDDGTWTVNWGMAIQSVKIKSKLGGNILWCSPCLEPSAPFLEEFARRGICVVHRPNMVCLITYSSSVFSTVLPPSYLDTEGNEHPIHYDHFIRRGLASSWPSFLISLCSAMDVAILSPGELLRTCEFWT